MALFGDIRRATAVAALCIIGVSAGCTTSPQSNSVQSDAVGADISVQESRGPLTMIIASDPQLPWWRGQTAADCKTDDCVSDRANLSNFQQVMGMNRITEIKSVSDGTTGKWPQSDELVVGSGSKVLTPRAVIMNGDLTAFFHGWQVNMYKHYFENDPKNLSSKKLTLPILPGLGNHDYANNLNDCADNSCARNAVNYIRNMLDKNSVPNFASPAFGGVRIVNKDTAGSAHSLAYSYEIDDIHFVQLHNFPTYTAKGKGVNITSSIEWLKEDLSLATNKWIVINMHDYGCPYGDNGCHFRADDAQWLSAIDPYKDRILGVFSGHYHPLHGWMGNVPNTNIPYFRSGASEFGTFLLTEFGDKVIEGKNRKYMNVGVVHSTTWEPANSIGAVATKQGLAAAFDPNRGLTFAAWNGYHNDGIYFSQYDGTSWVRQSKICWSDDRIVCALSDRKPALAYFSKTGSIWAAWKSHKDDQVRVSELVGTDWTKSSPIPYATSKEGPALAEFEGNLVATWKGQTNNDVYWSKFDGSEWSRPLSVPGLSTKTSPALSAYNGKLYFAINGDNNNGIYYVTLDTLNGAKGKWSSPRRIDGVATKKGPALSVHDGKLWAAWNGYHNDGLFYSSFNGSSWSPQRRITLSESKQGNIPKTSPALATWTDNKLVSVWNRGNNKGIVFSTYLDGLQFYKGSETEAELLKTFLYPPE